eukprot:TRINITY_DN135_c0_g1_i12.p1 TRINITY_DN135_c0_g1~~TRINITY_DN135_c0_g1_i12.p1  ORF type:complete len:213 (-),score=58.57 TRINITY_DN135_c0_g1_i12:359-997(-)
MAENAVLLEKIAKLESELSALRKTDLAAENARLRADLAAQRESQARLAREIDSEEERISNRMGRKLRELRRDKIDLENQLEQEAECIVNRLQRRLGEVQRDKAELMARTAGPPADLLALLDTSTDHLFNRMTAHQRTLSRHLAVTRSALAVSLERIESLENANFLLIQKANRDKEIREGAARCEVEREMLGERLFNSGGRRRSQASEGDNHS